MPSPGESLSLRGQVRDEPFPAVVTRSDVTGVWCVRLDGDARFPIGPCSGATRLAVGGGSVERLPVRSRVLLLFTDDGPWVLSHDREVT